MSTVSKHIAFLCSRLDLPGGIERAITNTANLFFSEGHKVSLLILDETAETFYRINPEITIIQQSLSFGITQEGNIVTRKIKFLGDVLQLRKLLKRINADIVIATEYPFAAAALLSGAKKQSKIVSWEHHHMYELKRSPFWNKLFNLAYPRLNAVVCLNEDERKLFTIVNKNPVVIPNFIEPGTASELTNNLILTVARLTHVKGTDSLLQVAKTVLEKHPGWQWKLIGDGDMKTDVLDFIENENLQDWLILQLPVNENILPEYQQASLYVMTSRNECFPMTLLEAQAAGLPCISFDCETGPRHIITHNENGLLVEKENPDKLAEAVSLLINNEEQRKKMGKNALQNVQRFSPEKIYQLWEPLLK